MIGESAALGSAFLWALSNILMGSESARVPAVVISALRMLYGALFLAAVMAVVAAAGAAAYPTLPRALAIGASGALGLGIGDTLYIGSLRRVGINRAFPISSAVYPLLTFVLGVALLDEQITLPVAFGSVLILIGVSLIVAGGPAPAGENDAPGAGHRRGGRETWLGLGLVLAASVLWAVAAVWLRSAAAGVQPVLVQAIRMPAALVVTAAVASSTGHALRPRRYGRRSLWALMITGVLGTGVGSLMFVVAVQQAGAARTAVLSTTGPLFGLPMAALLLHERVTPRIAVGTVLSIAGIWLVV